MREPAVDVDQISKRYAHLLPEVEPPPIQFLERAALLSLEAIGEMAVEDSLVPGELQQGQGDADLIAYYKIIAGPVAYHPKGT